LTEENVGGYINNGELSLHASLIYC
jgi:hypothetical protein